MPDGSTTQPPPASRRRGRVRRCAGWVLRTLLAAVALLALAALAAGWALPWLVERLARRELERRGLRNVVLEVQAITPWSAVLGPVRLGLDDLAPGVDSVRVSYSPRQLWRERRVQAIVLTGLHAGLERRDGRWVLARVDPELLTALQAGKGTSAAPPVLPFEHLIIRGARLQAWRDAPGPAAPTVWLDATVSAGGKPGAPMECGGTATVAGGTLVFHCWYDLAARSGQVRTELAGLPLATALQTLVELEPEQVPAGLRVEGRLDATAELRIAGAGLQAATWTARLTAPGAAGTGWQAALQELKAEGDFAVPAVVNARCDGALLPADGGGTFTGKCSADAATRTAIVSGTVTGLALEPLLARVRAYRPAALPPGLKLTGTAALQGEARLAAGRLAGATGTLHVPRLAVAGDGFACDWTDLHAKATAYPMAVDGKLSGELSGTLTRLTAGTLVFDDAGAPLARLDAHGGFALQAPRSVSAGISLEPSAALLAPLLPPGTKLELSAPTCAVIIAAEEQAPGDWELSASGQLAPVAFALETAAGSLRGTLAVAGELSCQANWLSGGGTVTLTEAAGSTGGNEFACDRLTLWAEALSDVGTDASPAAALRRARTSLTVQGRLQAGGGQLRSPQGLTASGLELELPCSWRPGQGFAVPDPTASHPSLGWQELTVKGVRLQPGKAALELRGQTLRATTRLAPAASALVADAVATVAWERGLAVAAEVTVPQARITGNDPALAPLAAAWAGADFAADVAGSGQLSWRPGTVSGRATCDIAKADLFWPARKLSVRGAAVALEFPDLPHLRTAPAQRLTFANASVAGLPVDGGELVLAVEAPDRLFLERADLRWCGGWLRAYAFRFNPRQPEGDLVLYADRIQVEPFLKLFKSLGTQGSGVLYGRLPLALRSGRIKFSEGFFFSLPGQTGNLQMTDNPWLAQSLDAGGMDPGMTARVKRALGDFDYSVFRMDLETASAQEARLRFRVFGRSRTDPTLQPIDLNVNVNGPLEQLLNLGLSMSK